MRLAPGLRPVTRPARESTVATAGFSECQLTTSERISAPPHEESWTDEVNACPLRTVVSLGLNRTRSSRVQNVSGWFVAQPPASPHTKAVQPRRRRVIVKRYASCCLWSMRQRVAREAQYKLAQTIQKA